MLSKLLRKRTASLVVVQGRRRIGKSRLIEEFAKGHTFYQFSGIVPTIDTTAQSEREEFALQLSTQTGLPEVTADDWSKLFILFNEKLKSAGPKIVLFDEISWMGSKDPSFLSKLKNAWDIYFKKNDDLVFVLCGSSSAWVEQNILASTGFVGRISQRLMLDELSLTECNGFWGRAGGYIAPYEKLKILSVTGGVPRYLEEVEPNASAEENIKDLCFAPGGILVNEFEDIFSDLFSKKNLTYKNILKTLEDGPKEPKEIAQILEIGQTGFVSEYLDHLIKSGFISRDYTWHLNSGDVSRLSHFRLSDNYTRFYLKYIEKNRLRIEQNEFAFKSLAALPGWETIMGYQFENLVLKNRKFVKDRLSIKPEEIVSDNPFFQRPTQRQKGCQIDYLIQTRFGNLYVCEVKFSKSIIGPSIIPEMKKKLDALQHPKGFSYHPVLIHVNGVHQDVVDSNFFSEIINFGEPLER